MDTRGNLSNLWIPCVYLRPRNPSWIWIRYIQYDTIGTTLCHPQNWLCRCDALFLSRHLALISPLGHFNGDNAHLSPNHQTHKTQGDSKVYFLQRPTRLSLNYGEHNPSHVQRYALLFQLSHDSISSPYSLRDLQHKQQPIYSMLQIITIPKNISTSTSWTFSFIYLTTISEGKTRLSEGTTQRKHTHVTTIPR